MARDRWATWQAEAAGTNTEPAMRHVLALAVATVLLATVLGAGSDSSPARTVERPASTPVCAELARLERHGVTTGGHYRAVRVACSRVRAAVPAP
jgi:hypothetical protein